jgi:hypothetical protein
LRKNSPQFLCKFLHGRAGGHEILGVSTQVLKRFSSQQRAHLHTFNTVSAKLIMYRGQKMGIYHKTIETAEISKTDGHAQHQ